MTTKKSQVAMEFLITYGLAILVAVFAIVVLAYFGVFSPGKFIENEFIIYEEECHKKAEYNVFIIPEGLNYNEKRDYITEFREELRFKFGEVHCPDFYSNLNIFGCYYVNTTCRYNEVSKVYLELITDDFGNNYSPGRIKDELTEEWLGDNCKSKRINGYEVCNEFICYDYICNNKYYVEVL